MKKSTIIWIVALVIVLGALYIWSMMSSQTAVAPSTSTGINGGTDQTNPLKDRVPVFKVGTSATLGNYLQAANGMTLYIYTKDSANHSNCVDTCAVNWPPYVPDEKTISYAPLEGMTGKISAIVRSDGLNQVTYNGQPLYYWIKDVKQGDTTGQNVGGVWFVVKP